MTPNQFVNVLGFVMGVGLFLFAFYAGWHGREGMAFACGIARLFFMAACQACLAEDK